MLAIAVTTASGYIWGHWWQYREEDASGLLLFCHFVATSFVTRSLKTVSAVLWLSLICHHQYTLTPRPLSKFATSPFYLSFQLKLLFSFDCPPFHLQLLPFVTYPFPYILYYSIFIFHPPACHTLPLTYPLSSTKVPPSDHGSYCPTPTRQITTLPTTTTSQAVYC